MHLHGSGGRRKGGSPWLGILVIGVMLGMVIAILSEVGWSALVPLGFAALICVVLLWFMRATDRAA